MGALLFEAMSGLVITCLPFHAAIQWTVIVHTLAGALVVLPLAWYVVEHWRGYRTYAAATPQILHAARRHASSIWIILFRPRLGPRPDVISILVRCPAFLHVF